MSPIANSAETQPSSRSSELKLRLVSAAIGLPLLAVALYVGFWAVSIIAVAVAIVVGWETRDMADGPSGRTMSRIVMGLIGGFVATLGVLAAAAGDSDDLQPIASAIGIVFIIFVAEIALAARFRHVEIVRKNIVFAYGAAIVMSVTLLPLVVSLDQGREILTYVILVVFAADTGAYFVGKLIGKHKLAPNISPGKTWQGLLGGIAAAVLVSWLLSGILNLDYSPPRIVGVGFAIAIVGVFGDLAESWIKRLSSVKDSGGIIPGHGGILDRLDALAPNFMLIYFIERWLG